MIWTNPLFYDSVRLLLHHPAVELVGATSDPSASSGMIQQLQPEAVIWESAEDLEPDGPELVSILEGAPAVMCFSLSSNQIRIYRLQKRLLARAEDLLSLILGQGPAIALNEAM
ncbi:MAG TPA: hypothetical protein VLD63_14365 [Anaerolineales bacterium]|nr:hypothetical protein [Anaerolineales bacterium]